MKLILLFILFLTSTCFSQNVQINVGDYFDENTGELHSESDIIFGKNVTVFIKNNDESFPYYQLVFEIIDENTNKNISRETMEVDNSTIIIKSLKIPRDDFYFIKISGKNEKGVNQLGNSRKFFFANGEVDDYIRYDNKYNESNTDFNIFLIGNPTELLEGGEFTKFWYQRKVRCIIYPKSGHFINQKVLIRIKEIQDDNYYSINSSSEHILKSTLDFFYFSTDVYKDGLYRIIINDLNGEELGISSYFAIIRKGLN